MSQVKHRDLAFQPNLALIGCRKGNLAIGAKKDWIGFNKEFILQMELFTEEEWQTLTTTTIRPVKLSRLFIQLCDNNEWTNHSNQRLKCVRSFCYYCEYIEQDLSFTDHTRESCVFSNQSGNGLIKIAAVQIHQFTQERCYSDWFIIHKRYLTFIKCIVLLATLDLSEHHDQLEETNNAILYIGLFLRRHLNPLNPTITPSPLS